MCGGHTGHGPNTSYLGPFIRSWSPTMCAAIFMTAASRVNEPRSAQSHTVVHYLANEVLHTPTVVLHRLVDPRRSNFSI